MSRSEQKQRPEQGLRPKCYLSQNGLSQNGYGMCLCVCVCMCVWGEALFSEESGRPLKHIAKRSCLPLPTLALPTQRVNRRPRVNRRYSEDRPGAAVPPGANVMLTSLSMQIDTHQRPRWFTKAKIILPHTGPGLALIKNQHAPPRKKLIKARINGQMPHFCCSRSQAVRLRVENLKAALVNCRLL